MNIIERNFKDFCDRSGRDYTEVLRVDSLVGKGAWLGILPMLINVRGDSTVT